MTKKLIEVALPLEEINKAAAREKSIRHGHPSTLHQWWARRPLAACRAVLFASIVDDPSSHPELYPTEDLQVAERERLFNIIRKLVKWESTNDEVILNEARVEILRSTGGNPPPVLDPFCGGGSIPLEAQRLGLEAHGSDLNPVAVLITKALIEIPPKFAGMAPVNPKSRDKIGASLNWHRAQGLSEDVRYYGMWMRDEAWKRIGRLYPKVHLSQEQGGEATVIAWLWARTVTCPNPACGAQMPLMRTFALSTKKGKQTWVEPVTDHTQVPPIVHFRLRTGTLTSDMQRTVEAGSCFVSGRTKVKATFRCVCCGTGIAKGEYIDTEANQDRVHQMPIALVAEGQNGRTYIPFDSIQSEASAEAVDFLKQPSYQGKTPSEPARGTFASNAQGRIYGFRVFGDYFTARQLCALITFSDLVNEVRDRVRRDCEDAGFLDDSVALNDGGASATAYADAIATYLAFAVDKGANLWSSLCSWMSDRGAMRETFARQAIPMVWDFAEANPFSSAGGNFSMFVERVADAIVAAPANSPGTSRQVDAAVSSSEILSPLICTDPPYYDNIGYADLSDYFYVWLRRSLALIYPNLFSTLLTPKSAELIATPYRFDGSKECAQQFFENGLGSAFQQMRDAACSAYPVTIFYAFKQAETDADVDREEVAVAGATASTGWETMLSGLLRAGFAITGTWPVRTEGEGRILARGTNALASSIVLVCRPRIDDASVVERREFRNALRDELEDALRKLQHGNIAPVDLAQAAIGPGMAIFSRYRQVLEPDGTPMRVRTALHLINQALDDVLAEQEGDYDPETRWAVAWYEQYGMDDGPFGSAETLSRAKDASVDGLVASGIVKAGQGKVRLLRRDELPSAWDPTTDKRLTVWEAAQYLIRTLENDGEDAAAALLARCGPQGDVARELAYRLYVVSERKGWTQEAFSYNGLVIAWPDLTTKMRQQREAPTDEQAALPFD